MTELDTQANTKHDSIWAPATRYIVGIGLVLAGIALMYVIRAQLSLLIAAALIAFLVQPIVEGLHRRLGLPRGAAVIITYVGVLLTIGLILVIVIPSFVGAVQRFAELDWNGAIDGVKAWLERVLKNLQDTDLRIATLNRQVVHLTQPLLDALRGAGPVQVPQPTDASTALSTIGDALGASVSAITSITGGLVAALVSFSMMMLFSIYMSLETPRFHPGLVKKMPKRHRAEVDELINRLVRTWRGYLRGELNLMIITGSIVTVGNVVLGTPAALLLGIIAGLMEAVPTLGPILALIPAVMVALIGGSGHLPVTNLAFAVILVVFYTATQVFGNNFITPRVIGRSVNLEPLLVLVGMFVAGRLVGFVGAILTVPVLASGIEIVRYLYLKVLGEDPFPAPDEAVQTDTPT